MAQVNTNKKDRTDRYKEPSRPAVTPDEAGPISDIAGKRSAVREKVSAQRVQGAAAEQVLHAKRQRARAGQRAVAAAAVTRATSKHTHPLAFSRKDLCAVAVWGVHPLCPESYDK